MKAIIRGVTVAMPQRAPKKKKLEKDIQREIGDWLTEQGVFFWRHYNGAVFDRKFGGFRALPKYTRRGLPDLMVIFDGKFIGLEVKVPGYWKRTDDQIRMKDDIIRAGGHYHLVTSVEEVADIMSHYDAKFVPIHTTIDEVHVNQLQ